MDKKTTLLATAAMLALPLAIASAAPEQTTTDQQTQQEANAQLRAQNKEIRQQNMEARSELKDQRQQNMENRCQNIQTRIDTQTNRYENNKQMFATVFGNMKTRLSRLSERLKEKGIDTTKLDSDLKTLDGKVNTLTTDYDSFMTELKDVQADASEACGTSKGQFMGKLLGARKVSLTVRQDRLDIRNFFQTTVKSDLMAIRKQLETKKQTAPEKTEAPATTSAPESAQ